MAKASITKREVEVTLVLSEAQAKYLYDLLGGQVGSFALNIYGALNEIQELRNG